MALVSPVPRVKGFAEPMGRCGRCSGRGILQEQVLVGQAELLGSTEELPGGTARCSAASEGPPELHLLSCCDWQVLKAPQGLVFTWFGLFFTSNSRASFHAGYQLPVACSYLQPVCGSQLLPPHGLFSVSPLCTQG